jgi:hypothetical protein
MQMPGGKKTFTVKETVVSFFRGFANVAWCNFFSFFFTMTIRWRFLKVVTIWSIL